ncbi:vWA domain-containing protein [Ruegeria faecimaris]|uniref:vWA domain-containing protein n=1 Tax=Ruegeria faecimaris TaxID=686389 RepID=UPI00248FF220|nr:VWA domain-containing protein [Ruegeria faecimaris]
MTDELDKLKMLMDAATPTPDASRRIENLSQAQKKFDNIQGSTSARRPTVKRGLIARLTEGAKAMLNALSYRGALTATTAVAAVALIVILPQTRDEVVAPLPWSEDRADARQESDLLVADMPEANLEEPVVEAPVVIEETIAPSAKRQGAVAQLGAADLLQSAPASAVGKFDIQHETVPAPEQNTETFANADSNSLKITTDEPVSTFSIDVDTASYAIVRSSLMNGYLPPKDAARVEEMVNYFPYSYPAPDGVEPFRSTITVTPTPWNEGTQLVHVGIQGVMPQIEDRPPLNLVFLIDTSGSMQDANKLPLLKQSFRLMLSELSPEDQVSIVTYAGSAGQVLPPTAAAEKMTILSALDRLEAGGSTAGQAGLQQAYQVAEGMAADGEVTRVILATDGDFNVGLSDPDALKDFIARKRDSGTFLSVLGFGRGNLDDATMQALAQNGNGQAAYIDTLVEAQKVLVDQLTGALFPIANDVKIQVEFNPSQIAEYRLIGYETRSLQREDFSNDKVDAGDIGAGHTVTAIYEVTPVGSDAIRNGPLRYAEQSISDDSVEIGFFKMRYKLPGEDQSNLMEQPILPGQGTVTDDIRFSYAIAGFGQLLRGGGYLGGWTYADAIDLATLSRGEDSLGYRAEAVTLMRLAQTLAE